MLQPRKGATRPAKTHQGNLRRLLRSYVALLGPATTTEAAGYLDARRADIEQAWPDDLVEVRVGKRTTFLPADRAAELETPPEPDLVRLLGAFDPYLQARDRDLIVPDKAVHKALWPVLGRPGVVLADGEVAGTWRPKASGVKLTVAVEPFATLPPAVWEAVETEAARVAAVRGYEKVAVKRVD